MSLLGTMLGGKIYVAMAEGKVVNYTNQLLSTWTLYHLSLLSLSFYRDLRK